MKDGRFAGYVRASVVFLRTSVRLWEKVHDNRGSHGVGRPKDSAKRVQILVEARVMLRRAVELNPNYAALYANLIGRLNSEEVAMPVKEGVRTAREAVGVLSNPETLQDAIDELLSSGF